MGNNHFNRRNHVANAYHEDIYAKVISDKVSQSIRDDVKVQIKGVAVGKQINRELGLFRSLICFFRGMFRGQTRILLSWVKVRISGCVILLRASNFK